jgi:hypothetical protein
VLSFPFEPPEALARKRRIAKVGNARLEFGISECGVDFFVEIIFFVARELSAISAA